MIGFSKLVLLMASAFYILVQSAVLSIFSMSYFSAGIKGASIFINDLY